VGQSQSDNPKGRSSSSSSGHLPEVGVAGVAGTSTSWDTQRLRDEDGASSRQKYLSCLLKLPRRQLMSDEHLADVCHRSCIHARILQEAARPECWEALCLLPSE